MLIFTLRHPAHGQVRRAGQITFVSLGSVLAQLRAEGSSPAAAAQRAPQPEQHPDRTPAGGEVRATRACVRGHCMLAAAGCRAMQVLHEHRPLPQEGLSGSVQW